jgi:hypothetical protein
MFWYSFGSTDMELCLIVYWLSLSNLAQKGGVILQVILKVFCLHDVATNAIASGIASLSFDDMHVLRGSRIYFSTSDLHACTKGE